MTNRRKKPDQRRYERFQAQTGSCATVMSDIVKTGQVVDISRGGLSFCYYFTDQKIEYDPSDRLSLLSDGFYLMNLPYKVVTDFEVGADNERRCNIQFGDLSENQIIQIDYFICNYTKNLKPDRRLIDTPFIQPVVLDLK